MANSKNIFSRAFDAMIEGRTQQAKREIQAYRERFTTLNRF